MRENRFEARSGRPVERGAVRWSPSPRGRGGGGPGSGHLSLEYLSNSLALGAFFYAQNKRGVSMRGGDLVGGQVQPLFHVFLLLHECERAGRYYWLTQPLWATEPANNSTTNQSSLILLPECTTFRDSLQTEVKITCSYLTSSLKITVCFCFPSTFRSRAFFNLRILQFSSYYSRLKTPSTVFKFILINIWNR